MHFYSRFEVPTPVLPLLAGAMLLCTTMQVQAAKSASVASGKNGIVVAGEKRAAGIGTQVLEKGGNAADATTASLLALSVTKIGAFTFGGEASVLFYDARQQKAHSLWAQGAAPLDPPPPGPVAGPSLCRRSAVDAAPPLGTHVPAYE